MMAAGVFKSISVHLFKASWKVATSGFVKTAEVEDNIAFSEGILDGIDMVDVGLVSNKLGYLDYLTADLD
jgi:hypothetical protein